MQLPATPFFSFHDETKFPKQKIKKWTVKIMKKFIVKRYDMSLPGEMTKDMNEKYEEGYYPKEIKLDDYQNYVDATVIYEFRGSGNEEVTK